MDHNQAVTQKMAESYLLGELTPEQRDAFEEHYFDCAECAADVKAGAMLVANVKEVLRAEPASDWGEEPARSRSGWLSWLQPAYGLAAALALALLVYQNMVTIPNLKEQAKDNAPQVLPPAVILYAASRAASPKIVNISVEPKQPFVLYIDIPPGDNFASYTFDVQSENGSSQFPVPVSAEAAKAAKDSVPFLVRGSQLKPGKYVVVLRGHRSATEAPEAGVEIDRYPFSLEYKN